MQYWIKSSVALAIAVAMSGCSVFHKSAHDEINYKARGEMKVPAHLDKPSQDPAFVLEPGQYQKVSVADYHKPPAQIFNLAEGSWVEEGDNFARIYFDKAEGINNLKSFIWRSINDFLVDEQVNVANQSSEQDWIESGWFRSTVEDGFWLWTDNLEVAKQTFKFTIEQKEHQRTASVKAELLEYQSESIPLTPLIQQQLEVNALNSFITQYDFNYRKLVSDLQKSNRLGAIDLGFDNDGNAALITAQSRDLVFNKFSDLLESLGFSVSELDSANGLIQANYKQPDSGVWDSIWGDEVEALPLKEQTYLIKVADKGKQATSLTWSDSEGVILSASTMNALHLALVKGLDSQSTQ